MVTVSGVRVYRRADVERAAQLSPSAAPLRLRACR
jgi:hypothetical protein